MPRLSMMNQKKFKKYSIFFQRDPLDRSPQSVRELPQDPNPMGHNEATEPYCGTGTER